MVGGLVGVGYGKIVGCCKQAVKDGLGYVWVGKSGLFSPFLIAQVLEAIYAHCLVSHCNTLVSLILLPSGYLAFSFLVKLPQDGFNS